MSYTTMNMQEQLPSCETCKNPHKKGEHYCKEAKCPNKFQYYCEDCQDPENNLHRHDTYRTVQIINKQKEAWVKLIQLCEELQIKINGRIIPKDKLIRHLEYLLLKMGPRDSGILNIVKDYDRISPFLTKIKNHYTETVNIYVA